MVAPAVGFEPTTNRLTADRSTTELRWNFLRRLRARICCSPVREQQVCFRTHEIQICNWFVFGILIFQDAGWSSLVARQAHNLKAAGSNPAPATKTRDATVGLSRLFDPESARLSEPRIAVQIAGFEGV